MDACWTSWGTHVFVQARRCVRRPRRLSRTMFATGIVEEMVVERDVGGSRAGCLCLSVSPLTPAASYSGSVRRSPQIRTG